MKIRKLMALFLAVAAIAVSLPFSVGAADNNVAFTLSSDIEAGQSPSYGDTVTYTVGITENSGFCAGTLYFKPSDNLTYESSADSDSFPCKTVDEAIEGAHAGEIGIVYLSLSDYKGTEDAFCSITFTVTGLGDISLSLDAVGLISAEKNLAPVEYTVTPASLSNTVATPEKPVILTEALPDAVMGYDYQQMLSSDREENIEWALSSGALPAGLTLLNDGTLSGKPTEFGPFSFGVRVTFLDAVTSDEKIITLNVLEKPKKLELKEESGYEAAEDTHLTKTIEKTKLNDLLANFKNSEMIKVFNADGEVTDPDAHIGTGYKVCLMDGDQPVHTLTVVVLGDLSGDGAVGTLDFIRLRAYFAGTYELDDNALRAARVAGDQNIGTIDFIRLRAYFAGTYDIYNTN